MLTRCLAAGRMRGVFVAPQATQVRTYKTRLSDESFFEGKNLPKYKPIDESAAPQPYVVQDDTPPTFKVGAGVKLLGFKYPNSPAPYNKTFYAVAPRRPPMVLAGVAGDYVERLYSASLQDNELMKTEEQLVQFVIPMMSDESIQNKFFSNPTIELQDKKNAVATFAKDNKLSPIMTDFLDQVVASNHTEHLKAIAVTYSDLMKRVRCEATAEATFGRIPNENELARVKAVLEGLRSPTQYYVNYRFVVDPALGGGLILKMGEFELDGSLNTRTNEVHKHLVKSLQ